MDPTNFGPKYPACDHINRTKADISVNEDLIRQIINEAEVLPIFEQRLFQLKHKKNSSLVTNELLACRWAEFVKKREGKNRVPFQFPSVNDFHFCKYTVRYEPNETTSNRVQNRYQLKHGPGVDHLGQMPIPDDMHMRKSSAQPIGNLVKSNKKNICKDTEDAGKLQLVDRDTDHKAM